MATLAGIDLRLNERFTEGSVSRLAAAEFRSATVELTAGGRVEVHPGEGFVVAFLENPDGNRFIEAHEAVQRTLALRADAARPA